MRTQILEHTKHLRNQKFLSNELIGQLIYDQLH